MRVLGIGDNVVDRYVNQQKMYPGGNAFNIAVLASMCGAASGYLGVFGDDDAALHIYLTAKKLGIDLTHCRFQKGENGYAEVELQKGERIFVGSNNGGISKETPLCLTKLDLEYVKTFDLVHTSIFSYIEEELPALSETGVFVSMDFSDKAKEEYYKQCIPYLDCACFSCGNMELGKVKMLMKQLMSYKCRKMVLATRGETGAVVLDRRGRFYLQSPYLLEARDTMGAGDAFIACFLSSYLEMMRREVDSWKGREREGITISEELERRVIEISLYQAALFSAENCRREGAFGYGKKYN